MSRELVNRMIRLMRADGNHRPRHERLMLIHATEALLKIEATVAEEDRVEPDIIAGEALDKITTLQRLR